MANQRAGLHRLAVVDLPGNRTQRGVQFLDAAHRTDLRKLRGQFVVLHRVGWILVFQLGDQQRQKAALQIGSIASSEGVTAGSAADASRSRPVIYIDCNGH